MAFLAVGSTAYIYGIFAAALVDPLTGWTGFEPFMPNWVTLLILNVMAIAAMGPLVGNFRLAERIRAEIVGSAGGASRKFISQNFATALTVDFLRSSIGMAPFFVGASVSFELVRSLPTPDQEDGEPFKVLLPAFGVMAVGIACAGIFAWVIVRLLRRANPEPEVLNLIRILLGPDDSIPGSIDPMGYRRRTLVQLSKALNSCARKTELRLPETTTSAAAVLLHAAVAAIRQYAASKASLSRELTDEIQLTVIYITLLVSGVPTASIYADAADHWGAFDDDGNPLFERRHTRWSGIRSVFSRVGRGIEPTNRGVQGLLQIAVLVAVFVLFVAGQINLDEVLKKILG